MLTSSEARSPLDQDVLPQLPAMIANLIRSLPYKIKLQITEIRLRQYQPLMIVTEKGDYFVSETGSLSQENIRAYVVQKDDLQKSLQMMSHNSVYALEEELRSGFLTITGGHRVGLSGQVALEQGRVRMIKTITGLNIRIARQVFGAADLLLPYLVRHNRVINTLIISPPHGGKTTLLRDLTRQISYGVYSLALPGQKVGVVDERSEIGGSYEGCPQNDLGPRTDILDGCPKAQGMMMLIRSMSPDVLIMDELGKPEDIEAVEDALHAGVTVITTAHAVNVYDVSHRIGIKKLIENQVFERLVTLGWSRGVGTIEDIVDGSTLKSLIKRSTHQIG